MISVTPTGWLKKGNFFNYNGHKIFFRETGEGETLLLIHGFPTASWDWEKIWDKLAEKFHLIAPDMIGFGFSDKPKSYDYSIHDQADLHDKILSANRIKSVHILAHDYGNSVAQEMAARYLEGKTDYKIESIVYLNGGLFAEMHRPKLIQKLLISPIGQFLHPLLGKGTLKRNFDSIFGNKKATDEEMDGFWHVVEHNDGKKIFYKLIRYMSDRREHRDRWVNSILNADFPIRLIDGPEDPVSGRHLAEYYLKQVPNPDVIILEGVGHYPQTENPEGVLKYAFEFWEKCGFYSVDG